VLTLEIRIEFYARKEILDFGARSLSPGCLAGSDRCVCLCAMQAETMEEMMAVAVALPEPEEAATMVAM
jgi:hypothetical protein